MLKTVLFDFDGTIADTYAIIFKAFRSVYETYKNQSISNQEIVALFGPAEPEIIQKQFPEFADPEPIMTHYYNVYDRDHDACTIRLPELNLLLNRLAEQKLQLGIITGKGRTSLDISLKHLYAEVNFDITIAGDEVKFPKPHPEGILRAMQQLNSSPDETIFIGDSDFDVLAGKQAGVRTVGVNWFDKKGEYKMQQQPDYFCSTVTELEQCIEQLQRRG